jgi:small subunit ribosomal protein S6
MFMVHPDQSDQVPAMVERYRSIIEKGNGTVHRAEDLGRRQLAYPIQRLHKAHYYLMNIESTQDILNEILEAFRFNDAVLRHLVIKRDGPVTEESMLAKKDDKDSKPTRSDSRSEGKTDKADDKKTEAKSEAAEEKTAETATEE